MVGRAYPEYRNSGIEWLGDVPKHWSIAALKMLVDVRDGTHETPSYVEKSGGSYPLVTSKDVTSGELNFDFCKHISKEDYLSIIKRSKVDLGDILMPMIGTVGSPIVVGKQIDFAIKNLALFKTSSNKNVNTSFLNYFLKSSECNIQFSLEARGGVQNFVSLGTLRDLGIPIVPAKEQEAIANFLDHETAKIDTLIEKQQQLIKLLKEKRQAVISHAVTKGLNPNAPMRDSGVEWLGEVPAHWVITEIRYVTSQIGGGTPNKDTVAYWDGDIPWVSPKDMKVDYIDDSQDKITEQALSDSSTKLIPLGSVLIVVRGMILLHSVPVSLTMVNVTVNQDMKALVPLRGINGEYLLYLLKGFRDYILDLVESSAHGTKCLRTEFFERMKIAIPNVEEQKHIVRQLIGKLDSIDSLVSKAKFGINLLQERRTALISAAVTGKIYVRDLA